MARKKSDSTVKEMYLISLDAFMLLSAMGITLGIIFIVLKPTVTFIGHEREGKRDFMTVRMSVLDYNDVRKKLYEKNLKEYQSTDELYAEALGMIEGALSAFIVPDRLYRIVIDAGKRKTLLLANRREEGDFVILSVEGVGYDSNPINDKNKLRQELDSWEDLKVVY